MQRLGDILKGLFKELPEPMSNEDYIKWQAERLNEGTGGLMELDGYNCEKCRNKGLIFYYKVGNASPVSRECECRAIRRSLRLTRQSGLSEHLKSKTLDNFSTNEQWQMLIKNGVDAYLKQGKGEWLYVGGQSGCGKTHLCTAACMELLKRGKSLIFMSWQNALRELKSLVNEVEYCQKMSKYIECEVLYIDDLFKTMSGEMPSGADIKIAYEIINSRLDKSKVTIISSEWLLRELIEIDEALGSRIKQMCKRFVLSIGKAEEKNFRMR